MFICCGIQPTMWSTYPEGNCVFLQACQISTVTLSLYRSCTNSLNLCVSDVCVYMYVCEVIGFDLNIFFIQDKIKIQRIVMWSDWFCRLTWQRVDIYICEKSLETCICLWPEFVLRWPCVVDRTLKSNYYYFSTCWPLIVWVDVYYALIVVVCKCILSVLRKTVP